MTDPRRDLLRTELMRARLRAGLGGRPLAVRIDTTQATVSRVERGRTLPALPLVRAWLVACDADLALTERVVALAEAVHTGVRGWPELLDERGHAQHEVRERDAASVRVRTFQPTVVPGLLQTPEYARAVFTIGRTRDVEAAVAERVTRQKILYDGGRTFAFLIAEHVLRWPVGGVEVLAAQRDRILSLSRLADVEVRILPTSAAVAPMWSNFTIWELREGPAFAATEMFVGEHRTADAAEVALYDEAWDRLWSAGASGDDASRLVQTMRRST